MASVSDPSTLLFLQSGSTLARPGGGGWGVGGNEERSTKFKFRGIADKRDRLRKTHRRKRSIQRERNNERKGRGAAIQIEKKRNDDERKKE